MKMIPIEQMSIVRISTIRIQRLSNNMYYSNVSILNLTNEFIF